MTSCLCTPLQQAVVLLHKNCKPCASHHMIVGVISYCELIKQLSDLKKKSGITTEYKHFFLIGQAPLLVFCLTYNQVCCRSRIVNQHFFLRFGESFIAAILTYQGSRGLCLTAFCSIYSVLHGRCSFATDLTAFSSHTSITIPFPGSWKSIKMNKLFFREGDGCNT